MSTVVMGSGNSRRWRRALLTTAELHLCGNQILVFVGHPRYAVTQEVSVASPPEVLVHLNRVGGRRLVF